MIEEHTDGYDGYRTERRESAAAGSDSVPRGALCAERLAALRRRIDDRVHETDEMADAVMRRIVRAGDLR